MLGPEYMKININDIPQEIIDEYNLLPKVYKVFVYIKIVGACMAYPKPGYWTTNSWLGAW